MLTRPWVMPREVREYSDFQSIKRRSDEKLAVDILRAEQFVISYTNNRFAYVDELPEPVRTAVILLAESYGAQASLGDANRKKSETLDDYSYTVAESDMDTVTEKRTMVEALLEEYVIVKPKNGFMMKLRKL